MIDCVSFFILAYTWIAIECQLLFAPGRIRCTHTSPRCVVLLLHITTHSFLENHPPPNHHQSHQSQARPIILTYHTIVHPNPLSIDSSLSLSNSLSCTLCSDSLGDGVTIMKGNQALEALANICGGEVPPTENNNSNSASSSSNNNNGAQQQPANLASQHQALIQAAQQQLSQQSQQHSHQHQLPALTAQQVQQALAALQGSSGVGSNNNNNPASALSFLFGAGVPQAHSQPSAAPAAAAAPMGIEQLAYFQLLQQAQQQQRGVAVSPEQQALLMALQTGAFSRANPATTSGKSYVLLFDVQLRYYNAPRLIRCSPSFILSYQLFHLCTLPYSPRR
jgi:hypothetical protein